MNARYLAAIFAILLVIPLAGAVLPEGAMKIFAVTSDGQGLSADLGLNIVKGTGKVWVDVEPLVGTSTQSTALIASHVAKNYSGDVGNYDYFFDINSNASVVEGPSAGGAMALLLVSMLKGKKIPLDVGMTGTITEEGYIGAVGGVFEKAKEAARIGIKLFMIPKGEAKQTVKDEGEIKSINLVDYGPAKLGMKVVEISTIDDALKFAFSDIPSIDVNSSSNALPDFIPDAITNPESLARMKELTSKYVNDAKHSLSEAKTALSTTLINDSSLMSSLLDVLNGSEDSIKQAEILYDKNYLYSSANYAFLGKVNAMFVKDIANNPSIIEPKSTAFDVKLLALKRDISDMRENFSDKIFIEGIEWQIAALQRLNWAEQNYNSIKGSSTVVVINYGNSTEPQTSLIKDLRDYEFATAWVQASRDFYDVAKASGRQAEIQINELSSLEKKINAYIAKAEDLASASAPDEDTTRRLNSAKTALGNKDYLTAIFDSASAYALTESAKRIEGKNISELKTVLDDEIKAAESAVGSNGNYLWARLYLDHSEYFMQAAAFYNSQELGAQYKDSLENGISLAALAKELASATDEINKVVSEKVKEKGIVQGANIPSVSNPQNALVFVALGLAIAFLVLAIIFLAMRIMAVVKKRNPSNILSQIEDLKEFEKKLNNRHAKGDISDEDFASEIAQVSDELERLESLRKEKVSHLVKIEKLKLSTRQVDDELKELRQLYSKGLLTSGEFKDNASRLKRKNEAMLGGMSHESDHLSKDDSLIKETLEKARETRKSAKKKPLQKQKKKKK